eukprot:2392753-Prymnesium_polylepis.1
MLLPLDDWKHSLLGKAPRRAIQDAAEGIIVALSSGHDGEPEVSHQIEHRHPLEKTLAAYHTEGHFLVRQSLLERCVQRALCRFEASEEARHLGPNHAVLVMSPPDLTRDFLRLLARAAHFPQFDWIACIAGRRQHLVLSPHASKEEDPRDSEHVSSRAVVVDQRAICDRREDFAQPTKVARFCPHRASSTGQPAGTCKRPRFESLRTYPHHGTDRCTDHRHRRRSGSESHRRPSV